MIRVLRRESDFFCWAIEMASKMIEYLLLLATMRLVSILLHFWALLISETTKQWDISDGSGDDDGK